MPQTGELLRTYLDELRRVVLGSFEPGEALPPQRYWARMFGISQGTVRNIMLRLAREGHVTIRGRSRVCRAEGRTKARATRREMALGLLTHRTQKDRERDPLFRALAEEAVRRRVRLVECPTLGLPPRAPRHFRADLFRAPWNEFDVGLLLEQYHHETLAHPLLRKRRVLAVDYDATRFGIDSVTFDQFGEGWQLAERLLERGHRRFAVTEEEGNPEFAWDPSHLYRAYGFRAAAGAHGAVMSAHSVIPLLRYNWEQRARNEIASAAAAWAKLPARQRPTALLVHSAAEAEKFRQALAAHGLRVPQDLSLVMVSHLETCATREGLTLGHMWSDPQALARRILHVARKWLEGRPPPASARILGRGGRETRLYHVPSVFVTGASVAPRPGR